MFIKKKKSSAKKKKEKKEGIQRMKTRVNPIHLKHRSTHYKGEEGKN